MNPERRHKYNIEELAAEVESEFADRYDRRPHCVVAAPGRINLMGGHVDYNDGIVLPFAIDRYTVIAGAPGRNRQATGFSLNTGDTFELDPGKPISPRPDDWSNYVAGVIAGFRNMGYSIDGFDCVISSSVQLGRGLSSSASLEVAIATLLETLFSVQMEQAEKARICQQAEHQFAGIPCGLMDQFASVFGQPGQLLKLDCRSQEIEMIPWPSEDVAVLVLDSGVSHHLVSGEYQRRREESASALKKLNLDSYRDLSLEKLASGKYLVSEVEFRRARHIVTEIQRTKTAIQAIRDKDWALAGEQLYGSHRSLRDDYEVSCPELDLLVELAREIGSEHGVFGMRMTGGGFGGCTVALIDKHNNSETLGRLNQAFLKKTGRPYHLLKPVWMQPSRGAHVIWQDSPKS